MDRQMLNKIIGENIRQARNNNNLTLEDAAFHIDVSPSFLGLMERGKRGTNILNLLKLCDLYDCTLEDIVNGIPKNNENEYEMYLNKLKLRIQCLEFDKKEDIELLSNIASLICEHIKNNINYNFISN